MTRRQTNWIDCIDAARRKFEIARYHLTQLELLSNDSKEPGEAPPIQVQAHFEGLVVSVIGAVDQVAQATNSALGLDLRPYDLVEKAFASVRELVPESDAWYENPLGRDLRRLRVRMVHYSYARLRPGLGGPLRKQVARTRVCGNWSRTRQRQ